MARLRFLIDRLPDEALPRLEPRPSKGHGDVVVKLVSLKDCAPFMETWPPDFDELVAVATRLLLMPGGPLVLEEGKTTRLRFPRPGEPSPGLERIRASPGCRGLVCLVRDLVQRADDDEPLRINRLDRARLARHVMLNLDTFFWFCRDGNRMFDTYLPEMLPRRADAMSAGLPAKEDEP